MTDTARPGIVNSCLRKQGYPSRKQAERIIAQCEARRPERKLRAYFCDYCTHWHLTGAAEPPTAGERQP